MPLPVDIRFPDTDEDATLLQDIAELPVKPVFVMGLHRSGTTFLYDSLSRSFPLAHLTLYHLLYFDRLLINHQQQRAGEDRLRLNRYLSALGVRDRHIDHSPVGADEVEEYGFLLRFRTGSFRTSDASRSVLVSLCQKLLAVTPGSQAVLLKNPWDIGNGAWMAAAFPEARFVYIHREPLAVLNSVLNACLAYLDGPQPYLELLLGQGRGRRGYRSGYVAWACLRGLRLVIGARATARLLRPILARDVAKQVAAYRREVAAMPADRAVEVDYQRLVDDPAATMRQLQSLLGLAANQGLDELSPRQRRYIHPALSGYQAHLESLIEKTVKQSPA